MTKVVDHLKSASQTLFSFEILPPKKGHGIKALIQNIEPLMEFKPKFIDVTYHREEYFDKKHPSGLIERVPIRRRPGTVGICAALMNYFDVDTVPHIICGGFTKEETESALIDLDFLGVENVLLLRGDAIKSEGQFISTPGGHEYASDLIQQTVNLNRGIYLNTEEENAIPTNFCVGVAGYPEKHFEAPNQESDLAFLKKKIELGAEYIVTQMFFDNTKYFQFVEDCRQAGINVPIIPGLKPLTSKKQLTILPRLFHVDLPKELVQEVEKVSDNQVKQVGIDWAIQQSRELMQAKVPCLHYYSMGKSDNLYQVAKAMF